MKMLSKIRPYYRELTILINILAFAWLCYHPAELGTWIGTLTKNIQLIIEK